MARAVALNSVLIAANGVEGPKWYQADATGIYIGYCVEAVDADEVAVQAQASIATCVGIAGCPSYHDTTAEFAAGARVPVWLCGSGVEVWATTDGHASENWVQGEYVTGSDQTDGLCELDSGIDNKTIGRVARYFADVSGTKKNFRLLLNL